jgi:hypothetical protein
VFFLDSLNGGAWPLLVGGVICLVDSVNGRDPSCPVVTGVVSVRMTAAPSVYRLAAYRLDYTRRVTSLQDSLLCAR